MVETRKNNDPFIGGGDTGERNLYIQLFSLHGLVTGGELEMGRDADTGGQIKYVLELTRALEKHPRVRKVDLFTRLLRDKRCAERYAEPLEQIGPRSRIVRIQCGGTRYVRKELLWPHLDEYVDRMLRFIKADGDRPDLVHGHYADGGYVALELSRLLGVPFAFTGHSLGIPKRERLQADGISEAEMIRNLRIDRRIEAEREILSQADIIIPSTTQEARRQYGLYPGLNQDALHVIPPGIDVTMFAPFYDGDLVSVIDEADRERMLQARYYMELELQRFFLREQKPLILALSRPDRKKNIAGLVEAYGRDKELQMLANLAIFAGIRKDINSMEDNEREVLTELLLLMDKYDLYGKMAIPKHHDSRYEVPELYRAAARSQGVFVNPAFTEPFGLTLLEAGASGLPVVATSDGGPCDIIENTGHGLLIDPTDCDDIARAIKEILTDEDLWRTFSQRGVGKIRERYSWERHCREYLGLFESLPRQKSAAPSPGSEPRGLARKLEQAENLFVTDIDGTLLGDERALRKLAAMLAERPADLAFGVASGRTPESARQILRQYDFPFPDVIIGAVGSEIRYGSELHKDRGWRAHIRHRWRPDRIHEELAKLDFLELQGKEAQREFKISYYMESGENRLPRVHTALTDAGLRYTAVYSGGLYLDILPYRASKGKAVRYLNYKWSIPLNNIVSAGDTGNDEDMLRGEMNGIVVGNYAPELESLRGRRRVYFARGNYAAGLLEGLRKFGFLEG